MRYLNIGSGQRPFPGPWINVDCQERWKPDIVARGEDLPMIKSGSVDTVVLHHVLEHYGCGEAQGLIRECHRVLRERGSLLVFVPDMGELASAFMHRKIDTQIFMTNVYGAYMEDEADRHKWGYHYVSLYNFLRDSAPWRTVTRFDWRPIEGANLANDWWVLPMEAVK